MFAFIIGRGYNVEKMCVLRGKCAFGRDISRGLKGLRKRQVRNERRY